MQIKVSKIVPKGYAGITLWPFGIYVSKPEYLDDARIINHEFIHWEQQKELFGIFFYLLYGIEYVVKLFKWKKEAYRNIAAEREAYKFEDKLLYLIHERKRYAWLKYIFRQP